ncbi:MAG TPA: hypothetical protein VE404_02145, partial [Verrucomicrobiae bacterium]|nr:hypothetical protein [Verrucomicrobiae bacterium]
ILSVDETASGTRVDWTPVAGALFYNVIRGNVKNIRDNGVVYDLGGVQCLSAVSSSASTAGHEDSAVPPLGEAFFYLAEYHDGWSHSYSTEHAARPNKPGQGVCLQ